MLVKRQGGKTTFPTPVSERPEWEEIVNETAMDLSPSAVREQDRLRKGCHIRDSYRCIITKKLDASQAKGWSPEDRLRERTGKTEACHIVPFNLGTYKSKEEVGFLF